MRRGVKPLELNGHLNIQDHPVESPPSLHSIPPASNGTSDFEIL